MNVNCSRGVKYDLLFGWHLVRRTILMTSRCPAGNEKTARDIEKIHVTSCKNRHIYVKTRNLEGSSHKLL